MSKEFSLTAEQIQENYKKFFARIDKMFPERAEGLKEMYSALGEERLMFSPASSVNYYHNAIPGGYIDHVLRVMDFALLEWQHYESMGIDVTNFTVTELMFAAMHHDLGKLGFVGDGKDGYVFNTSEWHRKNQGKMYDANENIPFTLVQDRSLFLLQSYRIPCSWNEYLGIRIHDGMYDDANKSYYLTKQLKAKLRTTMPQILHNADLAASRYEFERWNRTSNEFNTKRLEDNNLNYISQQTEPKQDRKEKQKAVGKELATSFDEIFNKK
jgi:hypothetical protein